MKKKTTKINTAVKKINWGQYESDVFAACQRAFPKAIVSKNVKIRGRFSGRSRQIDILIEEKIAGNTIKIIVDCKLYNKKADVKHAESFIGMMADVAADKGLMISEKGYTESALKRAYNNPEHLELDIYSLEELKSQFQGDVAIPYSGKHGTFLFAPFGWVVDATRRQGALCTLYQKGLTLEEAAEANELAYVNFWVKDEDPEFTLADLVKNQEKYMSDGQKVNYIKYQQTIKRDDGNTLLRIADIKGYPAIELAGFCEFKGFIFFCIMFSREVNLKRNIRKMESLLSSIVPVGIKNNANTAK